MRLDGVGKRYGLRQPWIVRGVSLDVVAGRLIRLEGRNGSGKSTLLRVIAGVTVPSAGRVSGRPKTGYVPERFPGGLGFSAREYLGHMSRIHGLHGAAATAAVDEWLERLGAADYAGSPLRTLSKGMCQKVAIAQALLAEPGLLVLDEAWTGLDYAARAALDAAVAERLAAGGTVFFVDHHQARLAGKVDQRWQLGGGEVAVLDGPGSVGRWQLGGGEVAVLDGPGSVGRWQLGGGEVAMLDGPGSVETGPEPDAAVSVIEVAGLDAESRTQLAAMPGVAGIVDVPGAGDGGVITAQVRVTATASDAVLRQLLSWDDVHVIAVRPDPGAAP